MLDKSIQIGIVGLGLIGGSIAKTLSKKGFKVYANDLNEESLKNALNEKKIDGLLVIGSSNSSNSQRLVEVGQKEGCRYSQLIETEKDIDWVALTGMKSIGITAGASAPEILINNVLTSFKEKYNITIETVETATEKVSFKVPKILREIV